MYLYMQTNSCQRHLDQKPNVVITDLRIDVSRYIYLHQTLYTLFDLFSKLLEFL